MRILIVAPTVIVPGTNGGATHVTEISQALGQRHSLAVFAKRGSFGDNVASFAWPRVPPGIDLLKIAANWRRALKAARQFAPDVIYERNASLGLGVLLGRRLGVPAATLVLDTRMTRWSWSADALITTAPELVPPPCRHKMHHVHWGANTDRFSPAIDGRPIRKALGIADDEIVVGYTGAFYPWHGLETLVAAAKSIAKHDDGRRIRYLLVGNGWQREDIVRQIARRGLQRRFLLPGAVRYEDVPQYVAACDITYAVYDASRHREQAKHGLFMDPLKIFEYLSAGRAAIVVDAPNLRRLFEADTHAVFVPAADAARVADVIRMMAKDPARRRRLGEAGRELVLARYSWHSHAQQLESIFTKLLAHGPSHRH